ncbi:conserved hypothetical protein [Trichinella spiralis]|uniref:hypothetical protein n=1 Tax=Trichinella spiralis TaxID=6334 RepID=UPI0001EFC103|nr:conserved hypothetical protein [Trichinella spiralis]
MAKVVVLIFCYFSTIVWQKFSFTAIHPLTSQAEIDRPGSTNTDKLCTLNIDTTHRPHFAIYTNKQTNKQQASILPSNLDAYTSSLLFGILYSNQSPTALSVLYQSTAKSIAQFSIN